MTEGKKRSVSVPVLVLSVVCALCIGWIVGFLSLVFYTQYRMGFLFPAQETVLTGSRIDGSGEIGNPRIVRREILFHKPGNDHLWRDIFEAIEPGSGRITGRVYVEDQPVAGLKMALLIATGRRSQIVETDADGAFEIPIPPDRYFFNGFLFYNMEEQLAGTLLVNRLKIREGEPFLVGREIYEKTIKEFDALKEKLGSEEAARALAGKMISSGLFEYQFEVTGELLAFPDLHFRKPITVIGPKGKVDATPEALKFIWGPHPRAASYRLSVSEIIKRGTTTRYETVAAVGGIKEPFIDYADLLAMDAAQNPDDCIVEPKLIRKGRLYGIRVVAFDKDDQILTATPEIGPELAAFSVK
jgi:hypothetical protein